MAFLLDVTINLWLLLRNAYVRLLKRPPDYFWIELTGKLPEFESRTSFLRRRLAPGPEALSLEGLRRRLDLVSADGRARGIVLRIQGLDADWAALEEVRLQLAAFRRRGFRVMAYLIEADSRSYYLACAADEIYATTLATVNVVGVRSRIDFVKNALNRFGIEAEVFAVSPYKSAYDRFSHQDFTRESREQAERLLDRRYAELVTAVSVNRDISPEEARHKIDGAPYPATAAVREGLLEGACYEDELPERLGRDTERAKLAEWSAASGSLMKPYRRSSRRRVGLVGLFGTIVRGRSRKLPFPLPLVGGEQAGSESVVGALRTAERNRRVAAVLFHIDSRGGDALASDLIWREVERIRRKKPIVVLMGNAAASGGYYVAAAADHVVARGNTITGSIGVIALRPVADRLYGRLGVNPASVERGARSGLYDPSRRLLPDEGEVLWKQVQSIYSEFKDRVVRGRSMEIERLEGIAGGRIWTGAEALEHGLVDEIGGYDSALRKAKELAGIEVDGPETVLKISPPRNVRPMPGEPAGSLHRTFGDIKRTLSELSGDRVWALAPYEISED